MWLIVGLLGLVGVFFPKASWWLSNWWRVEAGATPSKASLLIYRIIGVVWVIVSIVLFISL